MIVHNIRNNITMFESCDMRCSDAAKLLGDAHAAGATVKMKKSQNVKVIFVRNVTLNLTRKMHWKHTMSYIIQMEIIYVGNVMQILMKRML